MYGPHRLYLPLREILRRDQILDLTGTLQVSLGAPQWGVCSPTHARVPGAVRKSPWATRRVKGIDPRVVDSRTRGRACARPSVTLLHALGYRDTMVALLLVVVARPVDSVESTCFVLSVELHFGSLEVYCALGRWPNPTRKLVSSQVMERWFASSHTCSFLPPRVAAGERTQYTSYDTDNTLSR